MKKVLLSSILLTLVVSSANAATVVEDALISDTNYKVAGTFGRHDFPPLGDSGANDWAFTTAKGDVFRLRGRTPTKNDLFGWLKVNIPSPAPAWYMFKLNGDVDGDGSTKFDWVLLSTNMQNKAAYKIAGVASNGSFAYSAALNIDYIVNGTSIQTGAKGAFEADKQQTYAFRFLPFSIKSSDGVASCYQLIGSFTIADNNQVVGKAERLDQHSGDVYNYKVTGVNNGGKISGKISEIPPNKRVYHFEARVQSGYIDGKWQDTYRCGGIITN